MLLSGSAEKISGTKGHVEKFAFYRSQDFTDFCTKAKELVNRQRIEWNGEIVMCCSMMGICSEKCQLAILLCAYTNPDGIAYYTCRLYAISYCSQATDLYSMYRTLYLCM